MTEAGLQNHKEQLAQLEAFMETAAYKSLQATLAEDLSDVRESILLRPPITDEDRSAVLILYGRMDELTSAVNFFEASRTHLKDLIAQAEDEETESSDNT